MAAEVFNIAFIEYFKVFITAILIYAIVFALLRKLEVLGEDSKIDSLIALLTAIIVSFSGVATYAISYAINWFVIIFFIVFLLIIILLFLGVKMGDVTSVVKDNAKPIVIAFAIVFLIIVVKSFFALNNAYDLNDPIDNAYDVDASFNTGVDDITNTDVNENALEEWWDSVDSDLIGAILFLIVIGVFVIIIGR